MHVRDTTFQTLPDSLPLGLYVDGEWTESSSGQSFDVYDPATDELIAQVADADPADAMRALTAADRAREGWARTPARDRAELLRAAFELVRERQDEFATVMTLEMGKPYAQALGEVAYGAEFLRWFSELSAHVSGTYAPSPDGARRLLVQKIPVGPSLLITPWNFPLAMATRKIAPALAAGCTTILKPAQLTPLTSLLFVAVLEAVGVPRGVVNVLPTSRSSHVVGPLLRDARLRKLSFTGSTDVGQLLLKQSAHRMLRVSMELGGNAPFVVLEGADVEAAVEGAQLAKLRNMGEACTAANRFIVHRSVHDQFVEHLSEAFRRLRTGPGMDPATDVGPLIDARSRSAVHCLVSGAERDGAKVHVGGRVPDGPGSFYPPTVISQVRPGAGILGEEIFGPVAPVVVFDDVVKAVTLANDTGAGLAAYVYAADPTDGLRIAERLETGMVGINTGLLSDPAAPFGGVKQSGLGREGGAEGIDEYLERQYVNLPV